MVWCACTAGDGGGASNEKTDREVGCAAVGCAKGRPYQPAPLRTQPQVGIRVQHVQPLGGGAWCVAEGMSG